MTQLQLALKEFGLRHVLERHVSMKVRMGRLRPPTVEDYRQRIDWLLEVFGVHEDPRAITYDRLLETAEKEGPTGKGLKFVTITKRFSLLKWALTEEHERGNIPRVPHFPRLPSDGVFGTDYHVTEEFQKMRAVLPQPWDTWVTLGHYTAMRRSDLHRARWGWFELDEPYVDTDGKEIAPGRWRRVSTKTSRRNQRNDVWLPMEVPLWEWLIKLRRGEPHERVAGHWARANKSMAKACWRAEVPPISPNGFRRSAVFRWYKEGRSDEWIRVALGHVGYGHREIARSIEEAHSQGGRTRPSVRSRHYYAADAIGSAPVVGPWKPAEPKRVEPPASEATEEQRRLFDAFSQWWQAQRSIVDPPA